jgi:hypothetical protein
MLYTKQTCLESLHKSMSDFYQKALTTATAKQ